MTQSAPASAESEPIAIASGRLQVHTWRSAESDGLAICIPGLSSNGCCFEPIARGLVARGRTVVAVDLRGRGRSEVTGPGTYGWAAHARDVIAIADRLDADSFQLIGHSMGAYVAMQVAADAPERITDMVLLDGAGVPEPSAQHVISVGLRRLDRWHPSADSYVGAVRDAGIVQPWNDVWERFYRYELEAADDGRVRARTSLAAALEDLDYGRRHRQGALWSRLRGPVLLVRAGRPLGDNGGFIVAADDARRFATAVPGAAVVEVAANHFGVLTDARAVEAVTEFLLRGRSA